MSASGAVYQPTTVTYDDPCLSEYAQQQRRWSSTNNRASAPVSYLARAIRGRGRCSTCTPSRRTLATLYCSSGVACAAIGLTLVIHGAIGCVDDGGPSCSAVYVTVICIGVVMVVMSALLLLLYMRHTRRCCFMYRRKDHLHVPTMPHVTGGSTSTSANLQVNNPSTDHLLVGAQPTATEPEHAHLMPKGDGAAVAAAGADDPRILLRPLNAAVDTDAT